MKIFNHEFRFFKYGIFTSEDNKTILLRLYGGSEEWRWDDEGYANKIDSRLKDYPTKQECEIIIMQDKTKCGYIPLETTALIKTLKQNFPNLKTIVHEDWDYDFDTDETLRILKPEDIIDLAWDLQREKKDYASAEAYYKLAYELARFGRGETWAGLWLGMLYVEQNKNLREAEELLKERANSYDDVGDGKVEYGKLLLKQGRIDEAWEIFLDAVFGLGYCYTKRLIEQKKFDEAQDMIFMAKQGYGFSDTQPRELAAEKIWELFDKGMWCTDMDYEIFFYCIDAKKCEDSKYVDFLETNLLSYINDPEKRKLPFAHSALSILYELYRDGKISKYWVDDEDIVLNEAKSQEKARALLRNANIWDIGEIERVEHFVWEAFDNFVQSSDIPFNNIIDTLYEDCENSHLEYFCTMSDGERYDAIIEVFAQRGVSWAQKFLNDIQKLINEDGEDGFEFNDEDEQDSSDN